MGPLGRTRSKRAYDFRDAESNSEDFIYMIAISWYLIHKDHHEHSRIRLAAY